MSEVLRSVVASVGRRKVNWGVLFRPFFEACIVDGYVLYLESDDVVLKMVPDALRNSHRGSIIISTGFPLGFVWNSYFWWRSRFLGVFHEDEWFEKFVFYNQRFLSRFGMWKKHETWFVVERYQNMRVPTSFSSRPVAKLSIANNLIPQWKLSSRYVRKILCQLVSYMTWYTSYNQSFTILSPLAPFHLHVLSALKRWFLEIRTLIETKTNGGFESYYNR